jgi:hypothetical protein
MNVRFAKAVSDRYTTIAYMVSDATQAQYSRRRRRLTRQRTLLRGGNVPRRPAYSLGHMPHALTQHAPSNATAAHHASHQSIASGVAACAASCHLVVARCDEDLSWVRSAAPLFMRIFIYNKCGGPATHLAGLHNVELIESPNVGSVGALSVVDAHIYDNVRIHTANI